MGIGFFVWRWGFFFARKRKFIWGAVFLRLGGVYTLFGGDFAFLGVISRFGGGVRAMRPLFRAQREIVFGFFSAGP